LQTNQIMKVSTINKMLVILLMMVWTSAVYGWDQKLIDAEVTFANGDKKTGYINHESYYELADGVVFYEDKGGEHIAISPDDVQELKVRNTDIFIPFELQLLDGPANRFLHKINEGAIEMYVFYDRSETRLFVKSATTELSELTQEITYKNGKKVTKNRYITVLSKLLYDQSDLQKKAVTIDFRKKQISALIATYNRRKGKSIEYKKEKDFQIDLAIGGSYDVNVSIPASRVIANGYTLNFGGLFHDPNFSKVFSGYAGLKYTQWSGHVEAYTRQVIVEESYINARGDIDFRTIAVNEQVRAHTMNGTVIGAPLLIRTNKYESKVSLLFEAGIFPYLVKKELVFSESDITTESVFDVFFMLNFGLAVNLTERAMITFNLGTFQKYQIRGEYRF